MSLANYHTHSCFCDGEGDLESYVKEALSCGFDALGFTSHAPLPFYQSFVMENSKLKLYCDMINQLKAKYKGIIQIYMGLEIDYIPAVIGASSPQFRDLGLDYTIGSIHMMKNPENGEYLCVDESALDFQKLLQEVFKGDVEKCISNYYTLIRQMIREHNPSIIGHLDLVKKFNNNNEFFREDEKWYIDEVYQTLRVIAAAGSVLEINTGGISRGYIKSVYPSTWILKEAKRLGIPIILNSDAHSPKFIKAYFEQAIKTAQWVGYINQRRLINGVWNDTLL